MLKKERLRQIGRRIIAPVTIMFIPHHHARHAFNMNIPLFVIPLTVALAAMGIIYAGTFAVDIFRYQGMENQLRDYKDKVGEFNDALKSVKQMERELKTLMSYGSKEKILENIDTADMGTMDIYQIQRQIQSSMETMSSIRQFLQDQKDLQVATPQGLPVAGNITSLFGSRQNPISGRVELHRGIDISAPAGTPVKATATGIVSFSAWSRGGGNTVVIEHGKGFSTCYAHNRANAVTVGQMVKRGDTVGYVGATGNATGNHVHYEIWQGGRVVNPRKALEVNHVP